MSSFEKNLSEGSVVKQLIMFSLPFLVSNIIQSLYSVADMLIVGRFSGTISMSGVNIGSQVTLILTNIVVGLCTGGTVLIAQYLGAKRRKDMEEATATLMTTLLIAAVIITVLMLVFKDSVLRLIQTPAESYEEASRYLTVTVIGLIFIFGYNVFSAIMRGMGDSKRPLYFVAIACITNVVLDLLLVGRFEMGALGAAIATVISQAVSMITCIVVMIRSDFVFDFKPSSFRIQKDKMGRIFRLGMPSAIQNGVTSFSFMIITALINIIGGVGASAAIGVVAKFNSFAILPAIAMGASVSTMCAQNIGAGKWDRAIKTCRIGTVIAFGISLLIFSLAQLFPAEILRIFNDDREMIDYGVQYMRTFTFDYLIVPFVFCINGLFIGAGHTAFSMVNNMLSAIILRVPAAILFGIVADMGLRGVGLGGPVASMGSLILIIAFLMSGKWKENRAMA
ncbi:MAG: MATE family efflux transporter [Coprococcus sp.]